MRLVRLPLLLVFAICLGGCGGIDRDQIGPGHYRITGYIYDADDRTLDHASAQACPAGYDTLNEQHSMVAEGPAWWREIQCKISN